MPTPNYPLYRASDRPHEPDFKRMNIGLWFERYFSGYFPDFSKVDTENRTKWLQKLKEPKLGDEAILQNKANALHELALSRGGQTRIYRCTSSFVTGLGNSHPLENGFLWHPTLGMPYLPGSAVKGLVRAVVETAYAGSDRPEVLRRWFGTAEKGDVAENSGQFIFFDALPIKSCALTPEIMTPHMGKWYEKGGVNHPLDADIVPGDWHSPVPVGYLTARDLSLQFAIVPRAGQKNAVQELDNVWKALDHALTWLGAGGKTALGFGVMERDQEAHDKRIKQEQEKAAAQRRLTLSAAMQQIDTFCAEMRQRYEKYPAPNQRENPNSGLHNKTRELATTAREAPDWSAEDKKAAAQAIEEWLPKTVKVKLEDVQRDLKLKQLKGST